MHDPVGNAMLWFIAADLVALAAMLWFEWESLVFGELGASPETIASYRKDRDKTQTKLDDLRRDHDGH